jgi:hypothetical protein
MLGSLILFGAVFALLSVSFLVAAIFGLKRRQFSGVPANLLLSALLLSLSALAGMVVVATHGYRVLTHEEVAAVIHTVATSPKSFRARFQFPDGREETFDLAGDQLYVDAHILKWKAIGTLVGLKTAYELDRVAGRYASLEEEQTALRTIYSVARGKPIDLFDLRRTYQLLEPLVDAEYGSATFIGANRAAAFELRVSATGLLIREKSGPGHRASENSAWRDAELCQSDSLM